MTQQVIEPELDIDVRGLTHVAPAVVGPFGQLWARIESYGQAIAAPTVFAASRGFLAPRWRPGNGGSGDGDLAAKRAVGVFTAPRGFLPTV